MPPRSPLPTRTVPADTLSNAFAYRRLSTVTVASNALRIPYAVDNLSFRSNLGINNPSSSPASVRISLLDNRGLLVNRLESVASPIQGLRSRETACCRNWKGAAKPPGGKDRWSWSLTNPFKPSSRRLTQRQATPASWKVSARVRRASCCNRRRTQDRFDQTLSSLTYLPARRLWM